MTIHYITPFAIDKNYGRELNERITELSDGWICLTDADAMFLTPRYGNQIAEVCEFIGDEPVLIGCMTNRLGRPIQRYKGEMSDNWDIKHHYTIAQSLEANHWCEVEDITSKKWVAGMFMLFRKSLWEQIKFKENCLTWDDQFSEDVRIKGGKLGLMKGLYMFHLYRIWADVPMFANQHLVNK